MTSTSRRKFIQYAAVTPVAMAAVGSMPNGLSSPAAAAVTTAKVGSITGNDPSGYLRFASFLGRKQPLALLAFNQTSAANLWSSVPYICQQGAAFAADGAQVLWSVPCPGPRQLEAIVDHTWVGKYGTLFKSILAASPQNNSPILIRLPWEFNLAWQENAAIDKNGNFNAALFISAFQTLSNVARGVSPRFQRIWCPNVTTMGLDPLSCWPGSAFVDIVAQDFYMQSAYNKPGDFSWFLKEQRGLLWGANFARQNGKTYGLSEWGMNSDAFTGDLNAAALWLAGLGSALHHQCWWDRSDVIDCRISDGTHPGLGAAFRAQFY